MPELEPIRTAPDTRSRPSRPQSSRTRSSSAPRLSRVFSAKHLDDGSTYHGGDHDTGHRGDDDDSEESDLSEKVTREGDEEDRRNGEEEVDEVRDGVRNERDLEAPLEKKQTTRSVKDPNLVRV